MSAPETPATPAPQPRFDPSAFAAFRFVDRSIDEHGIVRLRYALDDSHHFEERFAIPVPATGLGDPARLNAILDLLHWVAGVSYYKTAAPQQVISETGPLPPSAAAFVEALYSEGLGEFAVTSGLAALPRPSFPRGNAPSGSTEPQETPELRRVLVPIGGGKDSIVTLETVRRSGLDLALFTVKDRGPMQRTADVAGLPRVVVDRELDLAMLRRLNASGALNGHIPITAVISCVALLTAAIHGFDAVALANERSASTGNLVFDGIEVNHQFSKSARAELLLRAAAREALPSVDIFSLLRPASELAIARAFARLPQYHDAFTSCNTNFSTDPTWSGPAWCRDCPKCRFVFLILAPFFDPDELARIFGGAMLDDPAQFEGFALLTATGGHKPFECVGEEEESLAAIELLAADPRWRERPVVQRLIDEVLALHGADARRAEAALTLSDEHHVPPGLIEHVRAVLGA